MLERLTVWVAIALSLCGCDAARRMVSDNPASPASPDAGSVDESIATPKVPKANVATSPAPRGGAKILRVYVAGESIERRSRYVAPPFQPDGKLNERGGGDERNDNDEYGWLVPFADRLALRDPGLEIAWVGTDRWLGYDDADYSGSYPPEGPGASSAIAGTSIESWLEQREQELIAKRHCYDVAIAARGGNDFGDDDAHYKALLVRLVERLATGSQCNSSPMVIVTGHMPDDQRGGEGPCGTTYVRQQLHRFVERTREAVDAAKTANPRVKVRFVDMYTPFVQNHGTAAFPHETWSVGGLPDFKKIGRQGDPMHPRRLASIYAGEVAADALSLEELRATRR